MTRLRLTLALLVVSQLSGFAMPVQDGSIADKKAGVMMHATGTFEVKISPVEVSAIGKDAGLSRMTIDKVFSGELNGTSKGEMMAAGNDATGAGAYVALERVTGTLNGRSGSFLLMHQGTMLKSDPKSAVLHVVVVPHSGTGELTGLDGRMKIIIEAGKHSYDFEYQLP